MTEPSSNPDTGFEHHRRHLFGLAYRILGTVGDAEDVVQDAWLRWRETDRAGIRDPRAWLTTTTTRIAIDRLRAARAWRDGYVGPWLPEPLVSDPDGEPEAVQLLAEEVSTALLLALERLGPQERAALLLRDVFDMDYAAIATTLGKTPDACRQLVKRARDRVALERPRFDASDTEHSQLAAAFAKAITSGRPDALRELFATDIEMVSDGGGKVPAVRRPVIGVTDVMRVLTGLSRIQRMPLRISERLCNGRAGVLIETGDGERTLVTFEVAGGLIQRLYMLRNPEKLRRVR